MRNRTNDSSRVVRASDVQPLDPSIRISQSEYIDGGKLDVTDVVDPIYGEINKQYGTNEEPPKTARQIVKRKHEPQ